MENTLAVKNLTKGIALTFKNIRKAAMLYRERDEHATAYRFRVRSALKILEDNLIGKDLEIIQIRDHLCCAQRTVCKLAELNRPHTPLFKLSDYLELNSEVNGCIDMLHSIIIGPSKEQAKGSATESSTDTEEEYGELLGKTN